MLFADSDGGKTLESAVLLLVGTVAGALLAVIGTVLTKALDMWREHRTNRFQRDTERAKWLRERQEQVFGAIAVQILTGGQVTFSDLRAVKELLAPLSWLDADGTLFSLGTAYYTALERWIKEVMNDLKPRTCSYAEAEAHVNAIRQPVEEAKKALLVAMRAALHKS